MHEIEPHFRWRDDYIASEDELSHFYETEYNEFEFDKQLYNYAIHPQWDTFGSPTLYIKILYADYDSHYAIIELLGEWNDLINNDIMLLKRNILELLMEQGINRFILIGENVLNFHASDDLYYEEWFQDVEDGWIAGLNFTDHVIEEFKAFNIDYYINIGSQLDSFNWRALKPAQVFDRTEEIINRRIH